VLSCVSAQDAHNPQAALSSTSYCATFKSPGSYLGKQVRIRARITATKEGTYLWDPQCRSTFAQLNYQDDPQNIKSLANLADFLMQYGLSDHPVIATLTGSVKKRRCDGSLWRSCFVFVAQESSDVTLSDNIDHPF